MLQKTLPANHPSLVTAYNNVGSVYDKLDEYPNSLSYYKQAPFLSQNILPFNHPDLAIAHNNIGLVYDEMGDYSKALTYYLEDALNIFQLSLPSTHPAVTRTIQSIAIVRQKMNSISS